MNCTVCGKPHTKEHPLTIAHNDEWLCPVCLKELDTSSPSSREIIEHIFARYDIPLYGKSPISGYSGTIKVGNMELPIESFEIR